MGFWKNLLPSFLFNPIDEWRRNNLGTPKFTYSAEGEDLILLKLFYNKINGTYIDVGCFHPKVGSNTLKLYKRGWRGINIDPNPNSIELFKKYRGKDINLNYGVGLTEGVLSYYKFKESSINTFSSQMKEERINKDGQSFIGEQLIEVKTLENILDEYFKGSEIDVLDVDVEGFDFDVLKSNNWQKYRPKVVMVEDQGQINDSFIELDTYKFMINQSYSLVAKTYSTFFFLDKNEVNKLFY